MNTQPRFCTKCGAPLGPDARFCGRCGNPVRQAVVPVAPAAAPPPPPAPIQPAPQPVAGAYTVPASVEQIVHITPGLQRKKGFLGMGVDTYSLVATPSRLIFAYLDSRQMQEFVAQARAAAKAQGKGFFGQIGAQLGWVRLLEQQLANTPPDQILAQNPNSFFIPNQAISKVQLRESVDTEDQTTNFIQVVIHTASGKQRFQLPTGMNVSRRELKRRFQQTLGDIVR
ncbi:MAG: zinc ribbon domain-containing protein [Anaerolineae bacterium]|nr:zinc ribbon domain-containing protein [Anaerolineae bacterium]